MALFVEAVSIVIIVIGALEATYEIAVRAFASGRSHQTRKSIWSRFALWLILALEFTLAADIIRTAMAPTWSDIGQLGAIALIRTFLSYTLEHDIEKRNHDADTTA